MAITVGARHALAGEYPYHWVQQEVREQEYPRHWRPSSRSAEVAHFGSRNFLRPRNVAPRNQNASTNSPPQTLANLAPRHHKWRALQYVLSARNKRNFPSYHVAWECRAQLPTGETTSRHVELFCPPSQKSRAIWDDWCAMDEQPRNASVSTDAGTRTRPSACGELTIPRKEVFRMPCGVSATSFK